MGLTGLNRSAAARRRASVLTPLPGTVGPRLVVGAASGGEVKLHGSPAIKVFVGARPVRRGRELRSSAVVIPPMCAHEVPPDDGHFAVAYLDPRRYRVADAEKLAHRWRRFVPGLDDTEELFGDALRIPAPRIDSRIERAFDALEEGASVPDAAARVRLSPRRLTHLYTEALGAPPSTWRLYSKVRTALGILTLTPLSMTEAAHAAGFADSAHFTRSCRHTLGFAPSQLRMKDCRLVEGV